MTETQAERVLRIAAQAKAANRPNQAERAADRIGEHIAREWWLVTLPNADPAEIFFFPAQSRKEILEHFPKFRNATIEPFSPK